MKYPRGFVGKWHPFFLLGAIAYAVTRNESVRWAFLIGWIVDVAIVVFVEEKME